MKKTRQDRDPHAIDQKVATTLRSLREQQGMTLSALAGSAGLSPAYLSRVEHNRAALTLQNLALVAEVLQVPVAAFFEDNPGTRPLVVVRAGRGKRQRMAGRPALVMELRAAEKKGKLMEPMIVEIQPEGSGNPLRSHAGEEFNIVIEGRCRFSYGKEEVTLSVGDSVYYDASIPHAVHAFGGKRCRLAAVVASRDYLFHGDLSRLLQAPCK